LKDADIGILFYSVASNIILLNQIFMNRSPLLLLSFRCVALLSSLG